MDASFKQSIWSQFGAAVETLENAVNACPEELWWDTRQKPYVWYSVFHVLFFLDLYLEGTVDGFIPPKPFTLDELDPNGKLPEQPYSKDQLISYLQHCHKKCRDKIYGLTIEKCNKKCEFDWLQLNYLELLMYNMRHVQHHAAQLNLLVKQKYEIRFEWVKQVQED